MAKNNSTNYLLRFGIYFLLAVMILTSSQAWCIEPSNKTAEKEKLVIAQFGKEKFLLYLPLYIAMEEGLFAKRGLDVELKFVGNDDQIFATVISGDAMFGVGDPVFAAIAREKGGPGRIVAMMITRLGLSGYTNKPNIPMIKKPQDIKGLRISSFPAPSTTYTMLMELVKNNDLEKTGTKIVPVAIGAQMATLEAGEADIAVDLEPSVSIAENKGYRVITSFDQFTDPQAITGISALESTIKNRPELVQKVVSSLQEALNVLHSDREACLRVSRKLFPTLDHKIVTVAVDRMKGLQVYPKSVKVDDSYWQRTLKTRLDSGELKKPQTTDFTVDNRFAEEAIQELGHS